MQTNQAKVAPAFYTLSNMQTLFGRSRSWVLLQTKTEGFPKASKLGGGLVWRRADVDRYIDGLPAAEGCGLDAVAMGRVKNLNQRAGA